jgi:hypothetical protein
MSKSDAILKKQLDNSIGSPGNLKRRRFISGSNQDQNLWKDGGLTFGINGVSYGSCDFAWYTEESWVDPFDQQPYPERPQLVVEATDALNTRSFGDAQVQRIHHGLGSFRCNVDTVYWLRSVDDSERLQEYVPGVGYFLTNFYQKHGLTSSYLITTDLEDIRELVELLGAGGNQSKKYKKKKKEILQKMYDYFYNFLQKKYDGNWIDYLAGEQIFKTSENKWVKIMPGVRKQNWLDSSKRGGHIFVSKTIASKYLLIGSNLFDPNKDTLNILWPLMPRKDYDEINTKKSNDKEWNLLTKIENKNTKIVTNDEIMGFSEIQKKVINSLQNANLNRAPFKKNKNKLMRELQDGLISGQITLN